MIVTPAEFGDLLDDGTLVFDEPITIAAFKPTGIATLRHVLNGAMLTYNGGLGKGPALQIGLYGTCKFQRSSFRDIHLACPAGADEGIRIAHADHCRFENMSVQGIEFSTAAIRFYRGYSNTLANIYVNGGDIGIMAGIGDQSSTNVLNIVGGKVLNNRVGIQLGSTTFNVDTVDCSVCSECAVDLIGCSYGRVHLYTEKIGGTLEAESSVIRMNRCRGIHVTGMLNAGGRADYCLDVQYSKDVFNFGYGNRPRREFIHRVQSDNVVSWSTCEM